MKKQDRKPSADSEQVFKLSSQARGANQPSPGVRADGFKREEFRYFPHKTRNVECPELGWPPVPSS